MLSPSPSDAGLADALLRPAASAVAQQPQRLLPAAAYAATIRRGGSRFVHVPQGGQRRPLPRYEHAAAMTDDGRLVVVGGNHGGWADVRGARPLRRTRPRGKCGKCEPRTCTHVPCVPAVGSPFPHA